MSMNLHCNLVELLQTPTWVTNMCLVQPDGTIAMELSGVKARHALQIYKKWLQGTLDGIREHVDDIEDRKFVAEHCKQINAIENKRVLKVTKI